MKQRKMGLNDFCKQNSTRLLESKYRDTLAELLVAKALQLDEITHDNWGLFDLLYGNTRVEVQSSAYIQADDQEDIAVPLFDIKAKDSSRNRPSDVYVFSMLNEKDRSKINPLDLSQWDFYVAKTSVINSTFDSQESVAASVIEPISIHVKYDGIKKAIDLIGGVM